MVQSLDKSIANSPAARKSAWRTSIRLSSAAKAEDQVGEVDCPLHMDSYDAVIAVKDDDVDPTLSDEEENNYVTADCTRIDEEELEYITADDIEEAALRGVENDYVIDDEEEVDYVTADNTDAARAEDRVGEANNCPLRIGQGTRRSY